MTAPNRPLPAEQFDPWVASIVSAADILRAYLDREAPDESRMLFNQDVEGMAMALDAAGRLLPPDADTRTEWAVRWPGIDRDVADLRPVPERGARVTVAGNPGTELYRRTVSTWPDGSTLVGSWVPVPTTEES